MFNVHSAYVFQFDLSAQLKEAGCQNFAAMVSSLQEMVGSEEEVFWLARGLATTLATGLSTHSLHECLAGLLAEEAALLAHLDTVGGLRCPQYHNLWDRGFAGVFQPSLLARLWDKLIGGSSKVLAYVLACALFRKVAYLILLISKEVEMRKATTALNWKESL